MPGVVFEGQRWSMGLSTVRTGAVGLSEGLAAADPVIVPYRYSKPSERLLTAPYIKVGWDYF